MMDIAEILKGKKLNEKVTVCGWVRTFRANRFISLNDGSCLSNIQCVVDYENISKDILSEINTGCSLKIIGFLIASMSNFIIGYATYSKTMQEFWKLRVEKYEVFGKLLMWCG